MSGKVVKTGDRPVFELARAASLIPTVVILRTSVALAAEARRTLAGLRLVAGQHVVSVCQHNTSLIDEHIKKYILHRAPKVAESLHNILLAYGYYAINLFAMNRS